MADDFQLKWRSNSLDCYPTYSGMKDYVFTVHWDCLAYYSGISGGPYYGRTYSCTAVPSTATSGDYTPYENLQESQVLNWVWDVIGTGAKYDYEKGATDEILYQINPPIVTPPLPWPTDVFPILPPSIINQPSDLTLWSGTNGFINVSAQGQPLYYQWYKNGSEIIGASGSTLLFTNVQPEQSGTYNVIVNNSLGSVTSNNAVLTISYPELAAPTISTEPISTSAFISGYATFSSIANGYPYPTYQWLFNGKNIENATGSIYLIQNVQYENSGIYNLVATNYLGSATSSNAELIVMEPNR